MSDGPKGIEAGIFSFLQPLQNKARAFTLVEVLVSAFIFTVIVAALFMVLNIGNFFNSLSSNKADLQADVRRVLDVIARDVRQTISWEIAAAANTPSDTHIKFRQVDRWDTTTDALALDSDYIEYDYDSALSKLTRRNIDSGGSVTQTREFYNIVQAPFYTLDATGAIVPLNQTDLLTSRKLVVSISGQKQAGGVPTITFALTQEVKIRNE